MPKLLKYITKSGMVSKVKSSALRFVRLSGIKYIYASVWHNKKEIQEGIVVVGTNRL